MALRTTTRASEVMWGLGGNLESFPLFREPSALLWVLKPPAASHGAEKTTEETEAKVRSSFLAGLLI